MVLAILAAGVVLGVACDLLLPAAAPPAPVAAADRTSPPLDPLALERLAEQGRWRELWQAIPRHLLAGWPGWAALVLALATGLCWTAFLLQAIQIRSPRDYRLWTPLVAVLLGVLSVWPTMFLIFWQQHRWGLVESAELRDGLRFFLLGVGLREELAKFLAFLPLLPLIVRRRDELAALIVGGAVGVGFAMEENVGYIAASAGADVLGRLLTAAPFHMSLTGLVALAAYRACVWPRQCGAALVATAVIAVVAHGLYDAVLVIPALEDASLASGIILILAAYQFFRELRTLRLPKHDTVSLTANFLCCISTVAAVSFVCLAATAGWQFALDALAMGVVTQAIMAYVFLREMPDTLVSV